jgi:FkbM family methyltransferase
MPGFENWLDEFVNKGIASLEQKQVAVDVGANIGSWTVPLSGIFEYVVAFEPDARASQCIPSMKNVIVIPAAISDVEKVATLYIRKSPEQTSLLETHPIGGNRGEPAPAQASVQISCMTLDEVFPDGADFVKMDIEGGEIDALRGCVDVERWKRTFFVVECHDTFDGVLVELVRLGKTVSLIHHPNADAHPGHCWAIGE